jgi:pentatricopeptide repeat protein
MKAAGVDTAEVIYGSLIAALGRLGQYDDAMATYQELESSDVEPTARTYSQVSKLKRVFYNPTGQNPNLFRPRMKIMPLRSWRARTWSPRRGPTRR